MFTFHRFVIPRIALFVLALTAVTIVPAPAQTVPPATDSNTPLHLLKPGG